MLKISCSNLFRYFICPAALNHEQTYVEKEKTKYSEEGIAKHLEMQEVIEGTALEHSVAAEELRQEFLKIDPDFSFDNCTCENKCSYKFSYHDNTTFEGVFFELVGTPDLVYVSIYSHTLYIIDYKFGYNKISPRLNYQLLGYALLLQMNFDIREMKIKLGIYQDGYLDFCDLSAAELMKFGEDLIAIVKNSQKNYRPSPTACKWCSYREECPALNQQVNTAVKKITEADLQQLGDADMFQFRKFLMMNKKLIEYVLNDTETFFKKNLQKGGFYDWCSLKSNGSIQSWSDDLNEDEIAAKLSELANKDKNVFYEKKLKSVSQIKKLLDIPANLIITKDKAKSLKIKEEHELKTATDELF